MTTDPKEEEKIRALIDKLSNEWKDFNPFDDTVDTLVDDVVREALAIRERVEMTSFPLTSEERDALKMFKAPFRYNDVSFSVYDSNNNGVCSLRSWSKFSLFRDVKDAIKLHDALGFLIVKLLNNAMYSTNGKEG